MRQYAIISGSTILCFVRARSYRAAARKALSRLAEEYRKNNNIKILKVAQIDKNDDVDG